MVHQLYLVFDVESIGLNGEGFSVGYVVIQIAETCSYNVLEEGGYYCPPQFAAGRLDDREWVNQHVTSDGLVRCSSPNEVRLRFWDLWQRWRSAGAWLAADVAWPVEANFLSACIKQQGERIQREDQPYPVIDIASVRCGVGLDPLADEERLDGELPAHNPLTDSRQSARLLVEAMGRWKAYGEARALVDALEKVLDL